MNFIRFKNMYVVWICFGVYEYEIKGYKMSLYIGRVSYF